MLVSCGVEDIVGTVVGENLLHMLLVGDGADYGKGAYVAVLRSHHQTDVMHRGLRLVDEYHLRRLELCHLTHHFASNRSGSAGDEYLAAAE